MGWFSPTEASEEAVIEELDAATYTDDRGDYAIVRPIPSDTVPCADDVAELLRTTTTLSAANAAEVVDQLTRVYGSDPDDVHADLALLAHAGMQLDPVNADLGLLAGLVRAEGGAIHGLADSRGATP